MKLTERLRALWADEQKRVNLLVAMGVAGLALLALSSFAPQQTEKQERLAAAPQTSYAETLERRLETLISQMDGAGRTSVMVTLAAQQQNIYAADTTEEADGSRRSEHVLLGSGGAEALVETTLEPQILGVAVVCEGGGDAATQLRITQLVQALTDVGASHITVTRMTG